MIDVKDLKVGNWVHDGQVSQFPMFITSVRDDGYLTLNFHGNEGMDWESESKQIEGIPLNDDVLLKMGFGKCNASWEHFNNDVVVKLCNSGWLSIEVYKHGMMFRRCTCNSVRYVHELQNIYQAISQKELKVIL